MNTTISKRSGKAIALATACAILGGTTAAVAEDGGAGQRGRIVTASAEVEAQGSAEMLQVAGGETYIVTQFCKTDGMLLPGGPPGFPPPPQAIPPRAALATTGLGKIATNECTTFQPGLSIAAGESVICDNSGNDAGRVCTVTGVMRRWHSTHR